MLVNSNQPCPQFWTNVFIIFAFFYLFFYNFFCFFELSVLDYVLSYFAQWFLCKVTCGFGLGCVHVILYNPTLTRTKEEQQHNTKGGEDWRKRGFCFFLFYVLSCNGFGRGACGRCLFLFCNAKHIVCIFFVFCVFFVFFCFFVFVFFITFLFFLVFFLFFCDFFWFLFCQFWTGVLFWLPCCFCIKIKNWLDLSKFLIIMESQSSEQKHFASSSVLYDKKRIE